MDANLKNQITEMIAENFGVATGDQEPDTVLVAQETDQVSLITLLMGISELGICIPMEEFDLIITINDLWAAVMRALSNPRTKSLPGLQSDSDYGEETIRKLVADWLGIPGEQITPETNLHPEGELEANTFELLMIHLELITGLCFTPSALKRVNTFQDLSSLLGTSSRQLCQ